MKWVMLLSKDQMQGPDFIRIVKAERKKICVIKEGGDFYATHPRCPHAGADLSYGWCKNGKLVCSFHRYQYDLKTGEGAEGQGDYLETYPLQVRDDGVYVGLEEKWILLKKLFGFLMKIKRTRTQNWFCMISFARFPDF